LGKDADKRRSRTAWTVAAALAVSLPVWTTAAEQAMEKLTRGAIERMLAGPERVSLNRRMLAGIDLSGLSLDGVDLSYAVLEQANLRRTGFRRAILWSVRATGADFTGADLSEAQLGTADLSGVSLNGATLRGASMAGTNLSLADLRGADLRGVDLDSAILAAVRSDATTQWPAGEPSVRQDMNNITLGPRDNGRQVEVRTGDTVTIRLPENPTTGYQWQLAADSAALGMVASLVHKNFTPPAPAAAGAGGERELVFTIRDAGSTQLRLLYKQPWGGDEAAADTYTIELTAKPQ
jgi:predicted secreted protein